MHFRLRIYSNKLLILLFIIVNQFYYAQAGTVGSKTILTRGGTYSLYIPDLDLPDFSPVPLISIPPLSRPALPNWQHPRFIPDEPSWLDKAGIFYKEGFTALYTGKLDLALKRFGDVINSYADTLWYFPSLFWDAQIAVRKGKISAALEKIQLFQQHSSKIDFPHRLDYLDRAQYTRIWLHCVKGQHEDALELLEEIQDEIKEREVREKLLYLKFYGLEQLGKHEEANRTLVILHQEHPHSLEAGMWQAEHFFRNQRWEALGELVHKQVSTPAFYSDPNMEKLLLMGIAADIELAHLKSASELVDRLRELGLVDHDLPLLASLRINIRMQAYDRVWEIWNEISDPLLRAQTLREMFRQALLQEKYGFIAELRFEEKWWHSWEAEGYLIRAHALRRVDKTEEAYRAYQMAYVNSTASPRVRETALFQRTLIELELHDFEKSEKHLQQLLVEFAESEYRSEYHFWYALVLYEKQNNPLQILMSLRQIELAGERADDGLFLKGKLYAEQSQWGRSIRALSRLKNEYKDSAFQEDGLQLLAQAYFKQKQHAEAQSVLTELRERFQPLRNPVAVIHLQASNLMAMKQYQSANQMLREDITNHPDFSLIQLRLKALEHLKDSRGILEVTSLGLKLSLTGNQAYLHFHRANALFNNRQFAKAFVHYEQSLLNPPQGQTRFIRFRLAKIHFHLQDYPAFLAKSKLILEEDDTDDYANETLQLLGNYHHIRNQPVQARDYLNKLAVNLENTVRSAELNPERRLELTTRIGEIYNTTGLHDQAGRWLNQALRLMDEYPEGKQRYQLRILREKGLAAFKQGQHERALNANLKVAYLDKTLSQQEKFLLNLRIASSYQNLNRVQGAKSIYLKMLKQFPDPESQAEIKKRLKSLK